MKTDLFGIVVLGFLGFLAFVPVLMLLQLSFKDEQQIATARWLPALPLHPGNYSRVFTALSPYLANSALFVVGTVTVSIVCSILTAYALARYRFPGRQLLYYSILALLMIPGVLTLITCFVITVSLKLNNTYPGVWLPLAAGAQPFQIIVLRTFFASIPQELFEAGRIDGADEVSMLLKIALPLSSPIVKTLIVLQTLGVWNEFIWPIMVLSRAERYPAVLAVLRLGTSMLFRDVGAQYAGYVIVSIPILILFAFSTRAFIQGLTSGAIKM